MNIDDVMRIAVDDRHAWIVTDEGMTARLRTAIDQHVAEAVAAETERCAALCESIGNHAADVCPSATPGFWPDQVGHKCAAAIRALADHDEVTT
jgi:hypothetical protein